MLGATRFDLHEHVMLPRTARDGMHRCSMRAHAPLTRVLDHVRRTAELHPAASMHEESVQRHGAVDVSIACTVSVSRVVSWDHRGGRDEIGSCPPRRADCLRLQSSGHL